MIDTFELLSNGKKGASLLNKLKEKFGQDKVLELRSQNKTPKQIFEILNKN